MPSYLRGAGGGRRTRGHRQNVPMLAGWLFADLFLVLFIVAFSSQPTVAMSKPTSAAKTTTGAHKATAKKPGTQGLESTPVDFVLPVSPDDLDSSDPSVYDAAKAALLSGVHSELAGKHMLGHRAGFVLIFATSVEDAADPIDEAVKVATAVIPMLKLGDPAIFPAGTGGEGLWGGSGDYVQFQIFFYTQ
jgi:hypothetical protein